MTFNSIGDLSQGHALRQQNSVLKQQMDRLSLELASGVTADVTRHLSGNTMQLADVEHKLHIGLAYKRGVDQGRVESSVMQTALGTVQTASEALSLIGVTFRSGVASGSLTGYAAEARNTAGTIFAALNTNVGDRALFAGDDVTRAPLADVDVFIAAVQTAVTGSASAVDVTTALDTFFDAGGGFETLVYQGGTSARSAYQLGEGESVSLDLRADHGALRDVLKQVATAAVLDDPGITLTAADRYSLAAQSGETLLGSQTRLASVRGDLGFAESRIERAAARLSAEHSSLEMVRADLLAINPYDTATELETVQVRLETLYTITSRTSRLSLVNFL